VQGASAFLGLASNLDLLAVHWHWSWPFARSNSRGGRRPSC